MYQLSDVRVYTYKEHLGYTITVPLVHKKTFTILRMIPHTCTGKPRTLSLYRCQRLCVMFILS